ncbi:hypothetical protein ABNF97_23085 [Plantactinospora sp. B6F1]|uniref:hypothetical protein n=1 Tax=Plantactinospora sp. B6F1 TaxID=3158971 RepID=UPI0032D99514
MGTVDGDGSARFGVCRLGPTAICRTWLCVFRHRGVEGSAIEGSVIVRSIIEGSIIVGEAFGGAMRGSDLAMVRPWPTGISTDGASG